MSNCALKKGPKMDVEEASKQEERAERTSFLLLNGWLVG
jgi:hypothetical protein